MVRPPYGRCAAAVAIALAATFQGAVAYGAGQSTIVRNNRALVATVRNNATPSPAGGATGSAASKDEGPLRITLHPAGDSRPLLALEELRVALPKEARFDEEDLLLDERLMFIPAANLFVARFIGYVNLFQGVAKHVDRACGLGLIATSLGETEIALDKASVETGEQIHIIIRPETVRLSAPDSNGRLAYRPARSGCHHAPAGRRRTG